MVCVCALECLNNDHQLSSMNPSTPLSVVCPFIAAAVAAAFVLPYDAESHFSSNHHHGRDTFDKFRLNCFWLLKEINDELAMSQISDIRSEIEVGEKSEILAVKSSEEEEFVFEP